MEAMAGAQLGDAPWLLPATVGFDWQTLAGFLLEKNMTHDEMLAEIAVRLEQEKMGGIVVLVSYPPGGEPQLHMTGSFAPDKAIELLTIAAASIEDDEVHH